MPKQGNPPAGTGGATVSHPQQGRPANPTKPTNGAVVAAPENAEMNDASLQQSEMEIEIDVLRDELTAARNDFNMLSQETASQERQISDLGSILDLAGVPKSDQNGNTLGVDERLIALMQQAKTVRRALEDIREEVTGVLFSLTPPSTNQIADARKVILDNKAELKQIVERSQQAALILVINQSD